MTRWKESNLENGLSYEQLNKASTWERKSLLELHGSAPSWTDQLKILLTSSGRVHVAEFLRHTGKD